MILDKNKLKEKFDEYFKKGEAGLNIGLPLPFSTLSEEVCGIQQGSYIIIAGSTG